MKRLLICLLLVGVVGCGKNDQSKEQPGGETAQNEQQQSEDRQQSGESEQTQQQPSGESEQEAQQPNENIQQQSTPVAKIPDAATVKKHMTPAQLALGDPVVNSVGMLLVSISEGTFMMGSPETEKDRKEDEHQHKVTITKAFYMQTTEVTQGQWKAVMGTEPWKDQSSVKEGANYPAVYVSWDDAVAYCKKLSVKEGKTYRLPTEAQWEYACRAGTKTTWSFGDDEKALGDYAWYENNAGDAGERYAPRVRLKKPNAFGLYNMHGNVFEWCHDYYGEDYYKQSPEKDPTGPASGSVRVLRGGSWNVDSRFTRSADRLRHVADNRNFFFGFRLVRELD